MTRDLDTLAERDARINALAQQVEKVRALHQPWDDGPQPYCTHDREPWPCPTVQALTHHETRVPTLPTADRTPGVSAHRLAPTPETGDAR